MPHVQMTYVQLLTLASIPANKQYDDSKDLRTVPTRLMAHVK